LSTLAIVLIVLGVLLVLFFVGGLLGARRRDRRIDRVFAHDLARADQALEQARASDKGWHRESMEQVARQALAEAHPGREFETLDLVLVDDRPGVTEDRAHFEASGSGERIRVVLSRGGGGWVAERIG
jgi:hypothetical protein